MINCCMSGGSDGADKLFGELAEQAGHKVIHWSFLNHHSSCKKEFIRTLSYVDLLKADAHLKRANNTLQKTFPTSSEYVNNLLRRNYYQVVESESLYAACAFEDKLPLGGTAWAIIMGINIEIPNVYVFDTTNDKWITWNIMDWKEIEFKNIPRPEGIYAGIGSSKLPENGQSVIRRLYES